MRTPPRKVEGVLNFIDKFESVVRTWPKDEKRPLTQLAEFTGIDLPHVVSILSDVLDNCPDVHDLISFKESERILHLLKQRMRSEIEAKKVQIEVQKQRSEQAYLSTLTKINKLQKDGNWYSAYRTLSYFAGIHNKRLCRETQVHLCNEILRLGIKANANFQELAQWLKKGIELSMATANAIEEALDFIDAYGEHFLEEKTGKGAKFIKFLLYQLKMTAITPESSEKLLQVTSDLNIQVSELSL